MRLLDSFFVLYFATFVACAQVSGIFHTLYPIPYTRSDSLALPSNPFWNVSLGWEIDGRNVRPGDTFTLSMPCVYKIPSSATSINLVVGSSPWATCQFYDSYGRTINSELRCVASSNVRQNAVARGRIAFPVSFNSGGSSDPVDLACARRFQVGTNTVVFNDGDNELNSTFTSVAPPGQNYGFPVSELVYTGRTQPRLNIFEALVLGGTCPNGI